MTKTTPNLKTTPKRKARRRRAPTEILRVFVTAKGNVRIQVLRSWANDPEDKIPAMLAKAVRGVVKPWWASVRDPIQGRHNILQLCVDADGTFSVTVSATNSEGMGQAVAEAVTRVFGSAEEAALLREFHPPGIRTIPHS